MRITFYGGVGEIGGNKVLLECGGSRVFLDFGRNFRQEDSYFQYPFDPPLDVGDLIRTGILPDISGLYRDSGRGGAVEAVVVSHAHSDHYGHIPLLAEGTRVLMGETAWLIVRARLEAMARQSWTDRVDHLDVGTFRTGDELEIGPFRIRPVHVDHSVPGAYGLLVECEDGVRLVYTGDLRRHGEAARLTQDFLREAADWGADVALVEGTRVAPEADPEAAAARLFEQMLALRLGERIPKRIAKEVKRESDVLEELAAVADDHPEALVMVEAAWADVDRARTVWRASLRTERRLVVDEREAYLLYRMREDPGLEGLPGPGDLAVMVWRRRRSSGPASRRLSEVLGEIEDAGGEVLDADSAAGEIWSNPGGFLFLTGHPTRALKDLMSSGRECRGRLAYVMSRSEPFTEEMVIGLDRLLNWLALYGVRSYFRIHVSGHASPDELREIVEEMNPRMVIPVHTEHPDLFRHYVPRDMRGSTVIPSLGGAVDVGRSPG